MIGVVLTFVALIASIYLTMRRLAYGIAWVMAVGYVYGITRANVLDGTAHFMFDAAIIGMYGVAASRGYMQKGRAKAVMIYLVVIVSWATLMLLIPINHLFIQLVGWRAAVLAIIALPLGAILTEDDLLFLGRALVVLNLMALGVAVAEHIYGVPMFMPPGPTTRIIYMSALGDSAFRLPSTFSSAHHYGGTMMASAPLVLRVLLAPSTTRVWRIIGGLGMTAALLGIFMCAARQPVVTLGLWALITLLRHRPSAKQMALVFTVIGILAFVIAGEERFQRFLLLGDATEVALRMEGSANTTVLDVITEYPLGAGLAGAAGTSFPSFMNEWAPVQVGAENEYARLALELGVPGLFLWLWVVFSLLRYVPRLGPKNYRISNTGIYAYVFLQWVTAFIGCGMLYSIPSCVLLMVYMGILVRKNAGWNDQAPVATLRTKPRLHRAPGLAA